MFYNQEHHIFHITDRCIRFAIGIEIPDESMASILDAYHQCWMQLGPAQALYYDGEGALNIDTAKAVLRQKALHLGCAHVDSTLQRSRPEMASNAIYFT
eukprot:1640403-Pyramimonas_sp.AAC.1